MGGIALMFGIGTETGQLKLTCPGFLGQVKGRGRSNQRTREEGPCRSLREQSARSRQALALRCVGHTTSLFLVISALQLSTDDIFWPKARSGLAKLDSALGGNSRVDHAAVLSVLDW